MYRVSSLISHVQGKEQVLKSSALRSSSLRYGVSYLANKRYRSKKAEYLQESIIPTLHFQPSLPRLPIPKLEDTYRRYLDAQKPLLSQEEYENTKTVTRNFIDYEGRALNAELVEEDANNKHTSFIAGPWYDMYLKFRPSIVLNHNPFIMLNDDPHTTDPVVRATKIIHTAMRFKNSLDANLLEPEVYHLNPKKSDTKFFRQFTRLIPSRFSWYGSYFMKAFPLDMSQYSSLFNTTRVPKKERDELRTYKEDNHILILRNGHFFVFDVVRNGSLLPKDEIHHNLCQVMKEGAEPARYSPGIFTSEDRDVWAGVRENLESDSKTAESLRKVDGALFVICLDDNEIKDEFEATRLFLHGDGKNRWFDKSFSMMLTKGGHAAINFEHSWGDGVAVLRFLNEIQQETTQDNYTPADHVTSGGGVTKLEFNLSDAMKDAADKSQAKFDEAVSRLSLNAFKIHDFDKNYLKKKKLSPDAMMQLAFQMAYYRMSGTTVPTYESCSTAAFKHGRTETIRPASVATVACKEAFQKSNAADVEEMTELLKNCSEYHGNLTKDAAMGQGFDRHLFGLKHIAERSGKKVPFFQDPSYRHINHIIMSTSTVFSPHVQLGGFAPVVPNGLGVGYMVGEDYLGCTVSSYPDSPSGAQFVELVRESLLDIYSVLEGRNFKN